MKSFLYYNVVLDNVFNKHSNILYFIIYKVSYDCHVFSVRVVCNYACPQMLRKSVETRDWLNSIEPRNVRAVMKRVVEDVTSVDSEVGQLYEEGVKRERSSDSSRRTYPSTARSHRSKYNAYAPRYVSF